MSEQTPPPPSMESFVFHRYTGRATGREIQSSRCTKQMCSPAGAGERRARKECSCEYRKEQHENMHATFVANLARITDVLGLCCTGTAESVASDAMISAHMKYLVLAIVYEVHAFPKKQFSVRGGKGNASKRSL